MPQTRMFRDRVVSMEQTLEGGEKNLEFLKSICREALPEFEYRAHSLDHERDLFVITLEAPDGRRKTIGWTRMVLFDAERLPALVENPVSPLRSRILAFLQARAARTEILVTFRHLEDGWVDTPEPRKEKRRGRRGGRDGRGRPSAPPAAAARGESGAGSPRRESGGGGGRGRGRSERGGGPAGPAREPRPAAAPGGRSAPAGPSPATAPAAAGGPAGAPAAAPGGRRRRFRRRRRGKGGAGGGASPPGGGSPPGAQP
ncbi:MAG: hypothetical protein ABI592_14130 [Acidobacteriota bacterium]